MFQVVDAADAPVQALFAQSGELDLNRVEPRPALRCVVELEPPRQAAPLGGREGFVQRRLRVRVELIENGELALARLAFMHQAAPAGNLPVPPAAQRLDGAADVGPAVALVLVVIPDSVGKPP